MDSNGFYFRVRYIKIYMDTKIGGPLAINTFSFCAKLCIQAKRRESLQEGGKMLPAVQT